jgi:hypothetical protein
VSGPGETDTFIRFYLRTALWFKFSGQMLCMM